MPTFHWSHKIHDMIAASIGAGAFAAVSLPDVDLWFRILVSVLTVIFLVVGIAMRTERFVRRMSRAYYGLPIEPTAEQKKEEDEENSD